MGIVCFGVLIHERRSTLTATVVDKPGLQALILPLP